MPVSITTRKMEISEGLNNLVTEKIRKLKKYFDKVDNIEVVFTQEKLRTKCEITIYGVPFSSHAEAENGDERTAFEKALKSISRQVKDKKNRMVDRKRKSVNPDKAAAELAEPEDLDESEIAS